MQQKQLNLGEIIDKLSAFIHKKDSEIMYDFGNFYPYTVGSWRGSYSEFSIGYNERYPITLGKFIETLKMSVDTYFEGYKGGDFKMTAESRTWVANYSISGHTGIVDVIDADYYIVIATAFFEY
jgi:hypothetical protein